MVMLAVFCVLGGLLILPGVREVFLDPAAHVILEGARYSAEVLKGI